jgi:putative colanic acid biosynthesis UDP-glucose lipid carrier transferase
MTGMQNSARQRAPGVQYQPLRDHSADVSACEPFSVFALKSLLYPITPVTTLFVCLLAWQEPWRGPYFLICVLVFFGVADVLDAMPARILSAGARALRSLIDITLRWVALLAFVWLLLKLSDLGYSLNRPMLWTWALMTPLALWAAEHVALRVLHHSASAARVTRQAVIVGATNLGSRLEQRLTADAAMRIHVAGYFEDRAVSRLPAECVPRILGRFADVGEFVRKHGIDIVYITLPMTPQRRTVELVSSLRDSTASVYFVPDFTSFELMQPRFDMVEGIPVIAVCDSPFYGIRGAAKRLSDIAIAGAALLILAPLLFVIAIGVRLSSRGPAIYRQKRYGLDGRQIVVLKFRSLSVVEDGERSYTQVARNDARLTAFGAFIRKTSLDELPQLFNVLLGDMSIVGPRPHAVAVNESYRQRIPGYMVRHKVKPGITGWAQVNGYRGGDDLDSMTMRIAFDLEYLRHWSLGLDLIILFRTVAVLWSDRHAY